MTPTDIDLLGKKKSKKKKKPFGLDELKENLPELDGEEGAEEGGVVISVANIDELDMDFSKQVKKKRKKTIKFGFDELLADEESKDDVDSKDAGKKCQRAF